MTDATGRRPGISFFVAMGAVALLVGMHLAVLAGDGLLYIAHGRLILAQGALPDVDPFSLSSVRAPLVLHMLLPMIGFAWVVDHAGMPALVLLSTAVGAAVLLLFLLPARRTWHGAIAAVGLLALLVAVDRELFEVRGQLFAYVWFAVWLALMQRAFGRALWPYPVALVVAALWANTHPSFLLAAVLPVAMGAAVWTEPRATRAAAPRLFAFAAVALCGALVSPYGPRLIIDVIHLLGDDSTHRIDHMRSPPLVGPMAVWWWVFLGAHVALLAARAARGPATLRRRDVVLGVVLLILTLFSRRYAAFACAWDVVIIAALAEDRRLLAQTAALSERMHRMLQVGVPVLAVAAMLSTPGPRDLDRAWPSEAATVLSARPFPDRLLNEFAWGGYLMERFGPARPVFIDGRNNLYRNGVFDDYLQMTFAAPTLDALLDVYGIRTVLWTAGWTLDDALRARPHKWKEAYRDDKAVIYVRRD